MLIQFYDRGSPQGKQFFTALEQLCSRLSITPDPQYIKDMYRPYSMGIKGKSILMINNQVVLVDKFPPITQLEAILQDYLEDEY